jgi:hypothetical protein
MRRVRSPERLPLERVVQALAVLCLVVLAVLSGKPAFTNASQPPRGIRDPMIALQMARDIGEVDAILGESPGPDREAMRLKQYIDFAFIASYVALFAAMGAALARRSRWGWLVAVSGVAMGVPDVLENIAILRLLPVDLGNTTQAMIDAIRQASVIKWSCASVAMVVLALFFLDARRWRGRMVGVLNIAAGALTCWGLVNNSVLVWGGGLMAAGVLASAATLKSITYEPAA